jgi:hypothetical protein
MKTTVIALSLSLLGLLGGTAYALGPIVPPPPPPANRCPAPGHFVWTGFAWICLK